MYYELYVDVFFMVNFTMDAILLILLKNYLPVRRGMEGFLQEQQLEPR